MERLVPGAVALLLLLVSACADDRPPPYERREGPRLPAAERRGAFEYDHMIALNICGPASSSLRRQAARDLRILSALLPEEPTALIKVKQASADYGDVPRDMTLRELAVETRDTLRRNRERRPAGSRPCQLRHARRLDRLLRE